MSRLPKKKRAGWIVLAGLSATILWFMFSGPDGVVTLYRSYREVRKARTEIRDLHLTVDSLQQEIRKLKTDTAYIEELARENLGMAKSDETVYKFIEKKE